MLKLRWASTAALSLAFLALAACSASASPLRQETPAETAEVEQPAETGSASLVQSAAEPVTADADQANASTPADGAPTTLYKGIPSGQTAGGFYVLGETNAPVTLTDYSDFL